MDMRQAAYRSPSSAKLERLEQIVDEASEDQRKVVIFSYFLHVLATVGSRLDSVVGTITGAVSPSGRQQMVDQFTKHHGHAVLLNQIEAGGVGINLQAASIVIITEPQWKPSTEDQAIARAHRMGQVRTVQVHRLLAKDSVDDRIREIQENKALLFAEYARRSEAKEADRRATDTTWHRPAELDDAALPLERRVILAEAHRLSVDQSGYDSAAGPQA
jgi:SNF2 family DNA or RNA helicase